MTRHALLIIFSFMFFASAYSQTVVPGGNVSGIWIKDKSPYQIMGDILIAGDSVLKIEPGVVVEFQGHYKLKVQGQLLAQGTLGDSVVFTIKDTTGLDVDSIPDGGWRGIRFEENNSTDSSRIEYCKVQYGKVMFPDSCGGGIFVKDFSKLVIANSRISNNKVISDNYRINSIYTHGGGLYVNNSNININSNTIFKNEVKGYFAYGGGIYCKGSIINIENCNIYSNLCNTPVDEDWCFCGGGGIFCENSSLNIKKNKINNNNCTSLGGYGNPYYIYVWGGGICSFSSTIFILNNEIENNNIEGPSDINGGSVAGGGISYVSKLSSDKIIIRNNIIKNNISIGGESYGDELNPGNSYGGGIYTASYSCLIENNLIENNNSIGGRGYNTGGDTYGGGIYNESQSLIRNNIISGNKCKTVGWISRAYGGGINSGGISYMIGNLILNNSAVGGWDVGTEGLTYSKGGGIYCGDKCYLINNTLFNNNIKTSYFYWDESLNRLNGNNIYNSDSNTVIINSIIWNNKDTIIKSINKGIVSYSDVNGGFIGIGNINQDPKIDSLSTNPYSLLWNSPCIDRGNSDTTGLFLPLNDIANDLRINNGRVDIGAYEYQGGVGIDELKMKNGELEIYPNPTNSMIVVSCSLFEKSKPVIELLNITGELVKTQQIQGNITNVDVSDLAKGVYVIKVFDNNGVALKRIIKQ